MSNEIKVLRAFIEEFHPFYQGKTADMTYGELTDVVKEIAKEME